MLNDNPEQDAIHVFALKVAHVTAQEGQPTPIPAGLDRKQLSAKKVTFCEEGMFTWFVCIYIHIVDETNLSFNTKWGRTGFVYNETILTKFFRWRNEKQQEYCKTLFYCSYMI